MNDLEAVWKQKANGKYYRVFCSLDARILSAEVAAESCRIACADVCTFHREMFGSTARALADRAHQNGIWWCFGPLLTSEDEQGCDKIALFLLYKACIDDASCMGTACTYPKAAGLPET